jgi:hypothetical protein
VASCKDDLRKSQSFSWQLQINYLVLLVFGDQIVHVALSFGEFHLIHTLTSIPMQESLAPEHGSKLFRDTLEKLLKISKNDGK